MPRTEAGGIPQRLSGKTVTDTLMGDIFDNQSGIYRSLVLDASREFAVEDTIEISAANTLEIPGTSILSILPATGQFMVGRTNNTSTVNEFSPQIQTGWVVGQPGVANTMTFSVNFKTSFVNVPIVNATFGGDTATTTAVLGSGGANINNAYAEAFGETNTSFQIRVVSINNWAAGNSIYVKWTAIGV